MTHVLFYLQTGMGGLGNGRRGGRSPPLLIGALIACILVLGFNYWVSSSRNLELQVDPRKSGSCIQNPSFMNYFAKSLGFYDCILCPNNVICTNPSIHASILAGTCYKAGLDPG